MSLYEDWLISAYNNKGETEEKLWNLYLPIEKKAYENILQNKTSVLTGTVKELSAKFHMSIEYLAGFLDGINDAVIVPLDMQTLKEDDYINLEIDFEKLYMKMVEYKAEHLSSLKEWDSIFTEAERKDLYVKQKRSTTFVREEKIGRNDICPCGSGLKYKKCCGAN